MKRSAAVLTAVLLLTLTGCAGTSDAAPAGTPTASASATVEATEAAAAPLVAETPETDAGHADAQFLAYVRDNLLPETQIPNATDEQLVAAGHDACDRIAAGEPTESMSLIDGETLNSAEYFYDSAMIITGARLFFCAD